MRYWINSKSFAEEKTTRKLSPMLLRQPAIPLKLDVKCSICDCLHQWALKAGATFGDVVHYLENEIECDCWAERGFGYDSGDSDY